MAGQDIRPNLRTSHISLHPLPNMHPLKDKISEIRTTSHPCHHTSSQVCHRNTCPNDVSPRKNSGSDGNGNATIGQLCRQTLATWALAVALTILAVVLLVDIPLRAMHRNDHVAASTPAATDSSTVIATSQVSASSVISSPSQRYHGTQFISFTINTLGGWGSR